METMPSPHDNEIIELLESFGSLTVEYPPELLAARRAAFIDKVKQYKREEAEQAVPSGRQFTRRLKELGPVRAEYPADLLAVRRAAFIAQIERLSAAEVSEELVSPDEDLLKLFKSIKAAEADYPPRMRAARRSAFVRQMGLGGRFSILEAWRAAWQRLLTWTVTPPSLPMPNMLRTSTVIALLMLAAFVGSMLRSREQVMHPASGQEGVVQVPVLATDTLLSAPVICKPGYEPPLCLAKGFEPEQDLTSQENGLARPAVAKDTMPGYSGVHDPAYINDGLYGPGSSWVSNSAYSWIKIDLGKTTTINTVAFGRDRLGHLKDGNPGQFTIAVALSDNVYADGNSNNDFVEYTEVYDSTREGFTGVIAGTQTVRAAFGPVTARFIKIIFANPGTTVDEVEAFMIQPPVLVENPTRRPKDDEPAIPATPVPSLTLRPTFTASPVPTDTLVPTDTATSTPLPTDTPTEPPTATNTPLPTRTPSPAPTDTPAPTSTPRPTSTPLPTDTPAPPPTQTSPPSIDPIESPEIPGMP